VTDDGENGGDDPELFVRGKLVGRPQALKLLPKITDLLGLFRQPLLIRVITDLLGLFRQPLLIRVHDLLTITVEDADVQDLIHSGHDDQILALYRDANDVLHRGHQS